MPTSFLKLPPELRQNVYDLALADSVVNIYLGTTPELTSNNYSRDTRGVHYTLPDAVTIRNQTRKQGNTIALLYTCRQVYCDLSPQIYSKMELRLHHNYVPYWQDMYPVPCDWDMVYTFIDDTRLAPFYALTSRVGCLTLPVDLFGNLKTLLDHYPTTLGALKQVIFYGNRRLVYQTRAGLILFSGPRLPDDVILRNRENAAILGAQRYVTDGKMMALSASYMLRVTVTISLGAKGGCTHGPGLGWGHGCKSTCHDKWCEVVFEYGNHSISLRSGRGWWELPAWAPPQYLEAGTEEHEWALQHIAPIGIPISSDLD